MSITIRRFTAGSYTVFSGLGPVIFREGAVSEYSPFWFGIDALSPGVANTTAFNRMMAAITEGGKIVFSEGDFDFDGELAISQSCTIEGAGPKTVLDFSAALPSKPTGTVTFVSLPPEDDTITLNGLEFTFKDDPSGDEEIGRVAGNIPATLDNTRVKVAAHVDERVTVADYTDDDVSVFTVASNEPGSAGVEYTLTENSTALTASAATLLMPGSAPSAATLIQDFSSRLTLGFASASVDFTRQPIADETLTLNGVIWTFIVGTSSIFDIGIGLDLEATLVEIVRVLNLSVHEDIDVATYTEDGNIRLTIVYDRITRLGEEYTIAASPSALLGATPAANLAQTQVRGSTGIHNKDLSEGPASSGLIANNQFNIGEFNAIQSQSDAQSLRIAKNSHMGTGVIADMNGSGDAPQAACREVDDLIKGGANINFPAVDDGGTHVTFIPAPGMGPNSVIHATLNRNLEGMTWEAVPQIGHFEFHLHNNTGATVNVSPLDLFYNVDHSVRVAISTHDSS